MATVLAREERFGEVMDVEALLALATNDANLHLVATLVNTELAPIGHVAVGRCRNDLDGVRQAVPRLVWRGLSRNFYCNP
jgi:ribosomal protein S12 methylthiotransferase accessory factor YcaO